ncbi:MAG: hypothetical protein IPJ06_14060 [Saprospiraceae bacterium]|nr:hypothetical protein [Saprospiraceae bacterium]
MRNWFLSIEGLILLWAFSGCDPKVTDSNAQAPTLPPVEEVQSSATGDTVILDQRGIPIEGQTSIPGSTNVKSDSNAVIREKPVVNPYNTKGPNQSKVDSIKQEKTRKK